MITSFYLFEYCDCLTLQNGEQVLYESPDAIPFLYYKEKLYVGWYGQSHGQMADVIEESELDNSEDYDVWNYIENGGRLYLKHKIISFWGTPDKSTFVNIINDLERELDKKIWNDNYKLELIRGENIDEEEYDKFTDVEEIKQKSYRGSEAKFIPIEEYKKSYTKNKKSLAYRQAVSSEKYKTKIQDPLFEVCDLISYGGKKVRFDDKTTIPFFYYKDELYVGKRGKGHGEMIIKNWDGDIYHQGRIFLTHKIISFWDIPDKSTFVNIINDLERKLNMKIWDNDFKLEIIRSDNILKKEYDRYVDFEEHDSNVKFIPIELFKKGYTPNKKSLAYRQAVSSE